jgi:pimeloyl-ACP methyl ester carboxylesterase
MKDLTLPLDGRAVHIARWQPRGERSGRSPLLLVHGLGGSTVNWELVGQPLSDRLGVRVDAIDLPGFGRTRLGDARATVGRNGQVVTEYLHTEGAAILVGNSMGGAISIGAAARNPELVPGVVLVDPALPRRGRGSLRPIMEMPGAMGQFFWSARNRRPTPRLLADAALHMVFHDPTSLDHDVADRLAALMAERASYEERTRAMLDATQSLIAHTANPIGLWREMRSIECPVLVVQGLQDRLVPTSIIREAIRHRQSWDLEVFENCGHVPQLECPELFIDTVVDWIEQSVAELAA